MLYFKRQYREAIEQYQGLWSWIPGFTWRTGTWDSLTHSSHNSTTPFARSIKRVNSEEVRRPRLEPSAMFTQQWAGRVTRKDAGLENLSTTSYVSPIHFALVHTALDNRNSAFQWLETAKEERACRLVHLKVEPEFDRLKTDPRFLTILSSMNLL